MRKTKEQWLFDAIAEYERRLLPEITLEWFFARDDEALVRALSAESFYIALDNHGTLQESEKWSSSLWKIIREKGSRVTFVIGGPEGIPSSLLQKASLRWSLSPLTFTHQMVRMILVEQIYRAREIEQKSPYHKGK